MRAAAVVQARMGSTRLPGKVLRSIAGQPLLWHILHRLKKAKRIDDIAVATSDDPADDAIANFALYHGAKVVRGPQDDVLERYRRSAAALNPDIIVRIVGDAPLVDPDIIDTLIEEMERSGSDFVMLKDGIECIHDGVDPFSRRALETLVREASNDPVAREHVTGYFKDHPEKVQISRIDIDPAYQFSGARTSVDTPDDIRFLEAVYDRLGVAAGEAYLPDVVSLLKREPKLMDINRGIRQKRTTSASGIVIIRCDASPKIGFGHVMRCLALGRALRDEQGLGVRFAIGGGDSARNLINESGFPIDERPEGDSEDEWLANLMARHSAVSLVLDVRTRLSRAAVARLRGLAPICIIDDGSDRRLEADLAVYPPVPQVRELGWDQFQGDLVAGWDVVLLSRPPVRRSPRAPGASLRVLLSMGGSDRKALTVPAVRALSRIDRDAIPFKLTVVLGPGIDQPDHVADAIAQFDPQAEILRAPSSLMEPLAASDLAILSFGVTAYEAAASGAVPIALCLDEDHGRSAEAFYAAGIGEMISVDEGAWTQSLADTVQANLAGPAALAARGEKASRLVDGKGATRVAERIAALVTTRKAA